MNNQPISFLLYKLATQSADREKFNSLMPVSCQCWLYEPTGKLGFGSGANKEPFEKKEFIYQEKIIRACFGRLNGEAVIRAFEGSYMTNSLNVYEYEEDGNFYPEEASELHLKTDFLYLAYDRPIRHGKSHYTALEALHNKMLEIVPEYRYY